MSAGRTFHFCHSPCTRRTRSASPDGRSLGWTNGPSLREIVRQKRFTAPTLADEIEKAPKSSSAVRHGLQK